jgi:hypothetical protein
MQRYLTTLYLFSKKFVDKIILQTQYLTLFSEFSY